MHFVNLERQACSFQAFSEELRASLDQCRHESMMSCRRWRHLGTTVLTATVERFANTDEVLRIAFAFWHSLQIERCRSSLVSEADRARALHEASTHRVIALLRTSHLRTLVSQVLQALLRWCKALRKNRTGSCATTHSGEVLLRETWIAWRTTVIDERCVRGAQAQRSGRTCFSRGIAFVLQIRSRDLLSNSFASFKEHCRHLKQLRSGSCSRSNFDEGLCIFGAWTKWRLLIVDRCKADEERFSSLARSSLQACRAAVCQAVEVQSHATVAVMSVRCFLKWQEYCTQYLRQVGLWQWLRGDRELTRQCFASWLSITAWKQGHQQANHWHTWLHFAQILVVKKADFCARFLSTRRNLREQGNSFACRCFTAWLGLVAQGTALKSQHVLNAMRVQCFQWTEQVRSYALVWVCVRMWHGLLSMKPWWTIVDLVAGSSSRSCMLISVRLQFIRWRALTVRARLLDPFPSFRMESPLGWLLNKDTALMALHAFSSWRLSSHDKQLERFRARCNRLSHHLTSVQRATEAIVLFNQRVFLIAVLEFWWENVTHSVAGMGPSSPYRSMSASPLRRHVCSRSPPARANISGQHFAVSPSKELMDSLRSGCTAAFGSPVLPTFRCFQQSAMGQDAQAFKREACLDEWSPGSLRNSIQPLALSPDCTTGFAIGPHCLRTSTYPIST
jgi:hypothetical protein